MPRFAAFLRGVMPMNAKMPDLKRAFEPAGCEDRSHSPHDRGVLSAYVRHSRGQPVFMTLIEKTFGKALTTRTWDTVAKVARA